MPGNGNPSGVLTDSASTSDRVTLMKLGYFRNCFFPFLDCFPFFNSGLPTSDAPSTLSAFAPGWDRGESSMLLWFEYCEPGVV